MTITPGNNQRRSRGLLRPRMGLAAEVVDITKYPLIICLLRAISIMVIAKDLSNLVH